MVLPRPHRGRRTAYGCLLALALLSGAAWLFHSARPAGAAPAQSANTTFVRRIYLPSNDLVYDGVSKMLYASVPSSAGAGGNSITPVDPATGAVGTPVFVGSEPGRLALSDDGRYLYTFLEGAAAIRRFDLTTQTPGLQFALRISPTSAPYSPFDFAVLPGSPESLAVSGSSTVAVYDNDVRRSSAVNSIYNSPHIEFSTAADTLYGVGGGEGVLPRSIKFPSRPAGPRWRAPRPSLAAAISASRPGAYTCRRDRSTTPPRARYRELSPTSRASAALPCCPTRRPVAPISCCRPGGLPRR